VTLSQKQKQKQKKFHDCTYKWNLKQNKTKIKYTKIKNKTVATRGKVGERNVEM
jgi:hypothetical protein